MKQDHDSSVFDVEAKDTGQPSVEGLVAKLEAATEGSAYLDAQLQAWEYGEIFEKLDDGPRGGAHPRDHLSVCWIAANNGRRYTCWNNKAYTRSLDAALTLVPQGCVWTVLTDFGGLCRARIYDGRDALIQEDGETPPLALCIAALRARQIGPQTVLGDEPQAPNTDESNNNTGTASDGGER